MCTNQEISFLQGELHHYRAHISFIIFMCLILYRQGVRKGRENTSTMSESIWTTLRMSLSLMGKPEYHEAVDSRDLDYLNQQFNVQIIQEPT